MCSVEALRGPQVIDQAVARFAGGSWGVLSHAELVARGLSAKAIRVRVRRGNLHPPFPGGFALGPRNIPLQGHFLAAVKACGARAVLSHYAAACLHGLLKWTGRPIDVTAPTQRAHPRIRAHRSAEIEQIVIQRVPVTPVLRTLTDPARTEDEPTVKRALRQARFSEAELARLPRRITGLGAAPTASALEDTVLDLILEGGLQRPEVNAPYRLAGRTVYPDLRWPGARLIVEVDSAEWHSDLLARRADAERQA